MSTRKKIMEHTEQAQEQAEQDQNSATYHNFEIVTISKEDFDALAKDNSVIRASTRVKSTGEIIYGKALISEKDYYDTAPEKMRTEWGLQKASVHCQDRVRKAINPDLGTGTPKVTKERVSVLNSTSIGQELLAQISPNMSDDDIRRVMQALLKSDKV